MSDGAGGATPPDIAVPPPPIPHEPLTDTETRLLELRHRTKNLIAVLGAIVQQTLRDDLPMAVARDRLMARLVAMGSAIDILLVSSWQASTVEEVVRAALVHSPADDGRVDLGGPPLLVGADAAMMIALAIHELEANALKHGALSSAGGSVSIRWAAEVDEACFRLEWIERGGPLVLPPQRRGFGSRLVSEVIARRLEGRAEHVFAPEGVEWRLRAPLHALPSAEERSVR